MAVRMAELRVRRGLHHANLPSCGRTYEPGDKVLVWRAMIIANRIGEWLGPYEVDSVDYSKKLVYIRDTKVRRARPFNVAQEKTYYKPELLSQC